MILQRRDDAVSEILATATYVVIYVFEPVTKQWERKEVSCLRPGLRAGDENEEDEILSDEKYTADDLMYRGPGFDVACDACVRVLIYPLVCTRSPAIHLMSSFSPIQSPLSRVYSFRSIFPPI